MQGKRQGLQWSEIMLMVDEGASQDRETIIVKLLPTSVIPSASTKKNCRG